jgi:NodT family efflux transporter outer membrane factor (OMF) lipoprotein
MFFLDCYGEDAMRFAEKDIRKSFPILPKTTKSRMSGSVTLLLLLASLLLASFTGCTSYREYIANGFKVGPNYCRPGASVAEQWLDQGNNAINGGEIQNAAWWQNFNDPVLESLISSAYQQNLSLRVAGLRILEARAERAIVAGEIFPQTQQAFGEYSRTQLSKNGPSGSSPNLHFNDYTLGGSLAWELDFWGRFRRAIEAADANLDASVESYDNVLVLLLAEVAQSYANVRIAEQRLTYAKQNVEIQQGSLRIAEDRLHHGVVTRLDVTQAVSNLEQTNASIRPLEAARRQAVNSLCVLMGIPPRNIDEVLVNHQGIPKTPPQLAIGIPAELLRRRPDVQKAERDVAAQSALIGVATSELYPHFSINGTIFVDAMKAEDLFKADSVAGSVGPTFRWNILNYGRLVNDIRVQQARFQQLAIQYQNVVLQANAEAENAIINLIKSQQQTESLGKAAEASRLSTVTVMEQYDAGTVDFNRVFTIQRDLTVQQDQLAVAEGSVAQYMIQLYRALGGGWQVRLNNQMASAAAPMGRPGQSAPPAAQPEPQPAPLPLPPNQPVVK